MYTFSYFLMKLTVHCATNTSGYKKVVLAAATYYTHPPCHASNGIVWVDYGLSGATFRTRSCMPPRLHVIVIDH